MHAKSLPLRSTKFNLAQANRLGNENHYELDVTDVDYKDVVGDPVRSAPKRNGWRVIAYQHIKRSQAEWHYVDGWSAEKLRFARATGAITMQYRLPQTRTFVMYVAEATVHVR